jgi:hypothetical protein
MSLVNIGVASNTIPFCITLQIVYQTDARAATGMLLYLSLICAKLPIYYIPSTFFFLSSRNRFYHWKNILLSNNIFPDNI